MLKNKTYDWLKWIAIIALPAIGWFYGEVGPHWGWPYIEELTLTLDRLGVLLAILLGVSDYTFKTKNEIIIKEKEE